MDNLINPSKADCDKIKGIEADYKAARKITKTNYRKLEASKYDYHKKYGVKSTIEELCPIDTTWRNSAINSAIAEIAENEARIDCEKGILLAIKTEETEGKLDLNTDCLDCNDIEKNPDNLPKVKAIADEYLKELKVLTESNIKIFEMKIKHTKLVISLYTQKISLNPCFSTYDEAKFDEYNDAYKDSNDWRKLKEDIEKEERLNNPTIARNLKEDLIKEKKACTDVLCPGVNGIEKISDEDRKVLNDSNVAPAVLAVVIANNKGKTLSDADKDLVVSKESKETTSKNEADAEHKKENPKDPSINPIVAGAVVGGAIAAIAGGDSSDIASGALGGALGGAPAAAMAGFGGPFVSNENKYSPVGNGDVVKMEYVLMLGTFDQEPDIPLAHTDSFKDGISLSEIKWGFVNTSNNSDATLGHIEFTLHDIAGVGLSNFMKVQNQTHYINFMGPDSTGALVTTSKWSKYTPVGTDCRIEFSPTQGFTYTLVGRPIVQLTTGKSLSAPGNINLTGASLSEGARFRDYLNNAFINDWNKSVPDENIEAKIEKFIFSKEDELKYEKNTAQVKRKIEGKPQTQMQDLSIQSGTSLADAVRTLFNSRFKADVDVPHKPEMEVNFVESNGKGIVVQIRFIDKNVETVVADMKVCIGDDVSCKDAIYRASLTNIAFNDLLVGFTEIVADGIASSSGDSVQGGNTTNVRIKTDEENIKNGQIKKEKIAIRSQPARTMDEVSNARWGQLETYLQGQKIPSFKLDIDMPYSFGFTPKSLGGKLKDSIVAGTGVGIHYTQGVDLTFFWYVNPDCQVLKEVNVISQSYRITNVSHTIGLNGNTTTVGLSHLHITI